MAKVSVIIPNYRHAPYLQERIDSVLAQTWRDFEIIILDDCSPDNSREVIERYRGNERITHIVYNEQNSGSTFVQWQKGFDLSQGEYIWIAESDDFAEPGFLAACVEQLDQDPACTLAYTESRLVDAESRPMKKRMKKAYSRGRECDIWDGEEFVVANMLRCNTIYNASMVVFRKSALPGDRSYTGFRLNGDWLFWVEIALQGRVAHINKALNNFRQHNVKVTRTTHRDGTALVELLRLYDILLARIALPRRTRWAVEGRIAAMPCGLYDASTTRHDNAKCRHCGTKNTSIYDGASYGTNSTATSSSVRVLFTDFFASYLYSEGTSYREVPSLCKGFVSQAQRERVAINSSHERRAPSGREAAEPNICNCSGVSMVTRLSSQRRASRPKTSIKKS